MSARQKSENAILDAARGMEAEERTVFLDQTCGADSQMRQRVEELLAAQTPSTASAPSSQRGPSGTVLTDNDATIGQTVTMGLSAEESPGDYIGRYKLLEKIGEGGFGVVYVAEQTEPVKRRVALKIIKLGMDTRQVVARFEAERQALALMDHPNIAKVLDAGSTETGRPYFVMELVRGTKITEHCDRNKLPTRKRLDLFMLVCRAIEHAHQKGIIHRDIKPSNILVTVNDGGAVPKVIDFGIAKATQGNLTEKTIYTQTDQIVGTPAYMSPEQAEAGGLDIDTRTDIYSLGVLLYELLTGETPLESKNLLARGFDEMRRLIREWEPQLPSIRLHKRGAEDQTTIATKHGTDAPKLIKMVRGDLDWVVMKCLEKDRARRYDSAAELTAEIERFLANEPVSARPPSKVYRFRKLVRRNRLAFAAGGAIFASLVAGLLVTSWFVVKEKNERDLAEKAGAAAERDLNIAVAERAKAEKALAQAEEAHKQSSADQQRSLAAEQRADAARREADDAVLQSREDRNKAALAAKEASDAQAQAQLARQQAEAAESRANSEIAKREAADKTAASEASLRQQAEAAKAQAETARVQAEAALQQATAARQQAEAAELKAVLDTVAVWQKILPERLETLPPAVALQAFQAVFPQQPWTASQLRQRGDWEARLGRWTNAIQDFSNAVVLDPTNQTAHEALAALMPPADPSGHHDGSANPTDSPEALAKTATNQLATGLAELNKSNYAVAARQFARAAMIQQQLRLTNDAPATLQRAQQIVDTKLPRLDSGDLGRDWMQWVRTRDVLREAALRVNGTNAPAAK